MLRAAILQQTKEQLMTEPLTIVRLMALEQAIQMVIHDRRIPENLRKALAVYQDRRGDQNNRAIGTLRAEHIEPTCLPKTIRSSGAEVCQRRNSRIARQESRNCEFNLATQEIGISLWHNDESLDWSIEIDGLRHEHVTSEIMEALVECALIVAQMSLARALAQRPQ
jgi:hypothetical protein